MIIVVAMIGVLAAVAMPTYTDYTHVASAAKTSRITLQAHEDLLARHAAFESYVAEFESRPGPARSR